MRKKKRNPSKTICCLMIQSKKILPTCTSSTSCFLDFPGSTLSCSQKLLPQTSARNLWIGTHATPWCGRTNPALRCLGNAVCVQDHPADRGRSKQGFDERHPPPPASTPKGSRRISAQLVSEFFWYKWNMTEQKHEVLKIPLRKSG